jgi:hypothetical protein
MRLSGIQSQILFINSAQELQVDFKMFDGVTFKARLRATTAFGTPVYKDITVLDSVYHLS